MVSASTCKVSRSLPQNESAATLSASLPLPEDWNVLTADAICQKIQDGTHFSPRLGGHDNLYITSKNIRLGRLNLSDVESIDSAQHAAIYKRCDVRPGDILLTKDGASTGNAAINTIKEEISLLSSVAFLRFDENEQNSAYFLQCILSHEGQAQIQELMSGNAITRLTLGKIKKLRFPVPPTKIEQDLIAQTLSDADALIDSLEALIAKKRAIKQGAVQDLLSGRKRLPGYRGEWKNLPLSKVGEVLNGLTYAPSDVRSDGILVLRSSNIQEEALSFKDNVFVQMNVPSKCLVDENDILICVRNGSRELIGKTAKIDKRCRGMAFGAFMAVFRAPQYDYVLQYFRSDLMRKQIAGHLGATINQITNKSLKSFSIAMPPTKDEADAISKILGDFDSDISELTSKLNKVRQLKQGMMQELLTGRVRLV
ncbi:restriction endonuclease subunit S [Rhizobium herbae]|uniref:Type I restriction enzyme S subunit n=1 Tax=Rhizobium herbae TaxID=508661 RepID=A0ABS4EWL3_9HYPH|nr:restriction endonuclease subunit S [Rhizobium herbae]MBP1862191.1 type I restriction enzyme S subunit [Rhizobium herbae]